MGLTFATPNGGNSKKTGYRNSNNNSSANNQTRNYSSGGGHPGAGSGGGNNGSGGYTPPPNSGHPSAGSGGGNNGSGGYTPPKPPKNDNDGAAQRAARAKALITQAEAEAKRLKAQADKAVADKEAAQRAARAKALITQAEAAAKLKKANDLAAKIAAQDKADAEKEAKRKALAEKNAAIEAETARLLAESEALTAATKKKTEDDARAKIVKTKREGLLNLDVVAEVNSPSVDAPVETKSTGQWMIDSFIPDLISESLKGEGNYSPEWVEKNKAAGASHLEALYASGQLKLPTSNITDYRGNAIGGVANSQDNTAMQEMAAKGVEDPLTALTKEVSDGTGLDTSFTGAYRQAIDGADGQRYDSGSGLLNYANDQGGRNVEAEQLAANEQGRAAYQDGGGNYSDQPTENEVNGIPVDDLSPSAIDMAKFSGNLGFATMGEAQVYWDSMTPEAQAIFNSKENPELSNKILETVFGFMIPGFGLLNRFMYNDKMTLQEKLEFSNKTAVTVENNKLNMNNGTNQGVANNNGSADTTPPAKEEPASTYANLESYLSIFNNRTY